jgi:cystathionine beta-lyase
VEFINQLKIFKIGMSWGGVHSLAVVYPDLQRPNQDFGGRIVRLNIGLEKVEDLTIDLAQAMAKIS